MGLKTFALECRGCHESQFLYLLYLQSHDRWTLSLDWWMIQQHYRQQSLSGSTWLNLISCCEILASILPSPFVCPNTEQKARQSWKMEYWKSTLVQQAQSQEKFQASKDLPNNQHFPHNLLFTLMPNLGWCQLRWNSKVYSWTGGRFSRTSVSLRQLHILEWW